MKETPRTFFTRDKIYGPIINYAIGSNGNILFRMFIIYLGRYIILCK